MTAEHAQNSDAIADEGAQKIALVVDLDGTLCRSDTLHEGLLRLLAETPLALLNVPGWIAEGRAGLKARVADRVIIAPEELPMNPVVIEAVRDARQAGRPTALVSAADHRQVTAVAEASDLFDEAYGSAEGRNLKGAEKAAFLTTRFGEKGFDYIGDSMADAPVWAAAHHAITVQANRKVRQAAQTASTHVHHIDPPQNPASAMVRAMRPHQWSKNVLMFLPALAAHDFAGLVPIFLGFIAFCLTASAVYVINDLVDLPADRAHPRKQKRPFAAGELTAATGAAMAAVFLLVAGVTGLLSGNPLFLAVLALYFVVTFAYSLWLKRRLIVDVITLAGLYTVRIIAGAVAASVLLSPWMLGFAMFLFLSLASVKRQAELMDQMASDRPSAGRAYQVDDLPILRSLALSSGNATVLVLALYISSTDVQALYMRPWLLWLICPLLFYWVTRMVMKAHRGQMSDDPIVFAATDRVSVLLIIACASIALAAAL